MCCSACFELLIPYLCEMILKMERFFKNIPHFIMRILLFLLTLHSETGRVVPVVPVRELS